MTLMLRPVLISVLCSMIALGHLPAWLHVMTCHGHSYEAVNPTAARKVSPCPHGCHHHAVDDRSVSTYDSAQSEDSHPTHEHDSDTCAICHSLASPVGFFLIFEQSLEPKYLGEPVFVCADRIPVEASNAIPQPRGPPALA